MVRRRVRVQTRHRLQKVVLLCGRLKFETDLELRSELAAQIRRDWLAKQLSGSDELEAGFIQSPWKVDELMQIWWVLWLWVKICGDVGLLLRAKMAPRKKRARRIASPGCGCYGWNRWDRIKHLRFLKECFYCMPVLKNVVPMLEYMVL